MKSRGIPDELKVTQTYFLSPALSLPPFPLTQYAMCKAHETGYRGRTEGPKGANPMGISTSDEDV